MTRYILSLDGRPCELDLDGDRVARLDSAVASRHHVELPVFARAAGAEGHDMIEIGTITVPVTAPAEVLAEPASTEPKPESAEIRSFPGTVGYGHVDPGRVVIVAGGGGGNAESMVGPGGPARVVSAGGGGARLPGGGYVSATSTQGGSTQVVTGGASAPSPRALPEVTAYGCAQRAADALEKATAGSGLPSYATALIAAAQAWRELGERMATLSGLNKPAGDDER